MVHGPAYRPKPSARPGGQLIPSATTTPLVDVMKSEMGQVIQVLRSRMQVGLRVDF